MSQAKAPPTHLSPQSKFALHIGDERLTLWTFHRQQGLHDATWEQIEEYEIDNGVEITGQGTMIKRNGDVWYLVDDLEDIQIHGT